MPLQGSPPKVALFAGILTEFWPIARPETIATLFAAWQLPVVKAPQVPLGVP